MPTRARSFGRLVFGSLTLMPSTTMSPFWIGSSALTALISVDLPDPDGPQTTMTSPFSTFVVQSVSTWKLPYHLDTSSISIIGMVRFLRCVGGASRQRTMAILLLQPLHERATHEADDEVDERREHVHLDQPAVALRDLRRGAEEIGDRQHVDERRVLEQDDRLREQDRQHVAERLRQHDLAHRLPVVEAERVAGRHLPARDRLDARAHDLAVVRGLEQRERDHRRVERADLDRLRAAR